jgi:NitT/TauT family transport system permease protein
VIAWSSALVCSLHVAASSRGESGRERALRAMGATTAQRLRWVVLPELVPAALTALRQACSLGLVVTVVTEMVMGAEHGLGARAVAAQIAYDTPDLYGVIACAGAIGWLASRALLALELRAGAWRAR